MICATINDAEATLDDHRQKEESTFKLLHELQSDKDQLRSQLTSSTDALETVRSRHPSESAMEEEMLKEAMEATETIHRLEMEVIEECIWKLPHS